MIREVVLAMMVKNEEKRIRVSFNSVKGICKKIIILDTGSGDRTIAVCQEWCTENGVDLHLKTSPFVNFCDTRNVLLDFADEVLQEPHFLLLLDSNDELKNAGELKKFVELFNGKHSGFHVKQEWLSGKKTDSYYNVRLVLSNSGWRYRGVVHEYICQNNVEQTGDNILMLPNIVLFQDRNKDDDKSAKRFVRDKRMLYGAHVNDPSESRTIFYLAQTCGCLSHFAEAYRYYSMRLKCSGFIEEIYHSYFRLADTAHTMNSRWEESFRWYLSAFAHSGRVEPLVKLAEFYMTHDAKGAKGSCPEIAWIFISASLHMMYPYNQILFVDSWCYVYKRHHLASIIGAKVGRIKEAKSAAIMALCHDADSKIDTENLLELIKNQPTATGAFSSVREKLDPPPTITKKYKEFMAKGASYKKWWLAVPWYLRAFEECKIHEPLVAISKIFMSQNYKGEVGCDNLLAWVFISAANMLRVQPTVATYVEYQRIFCEVSLANNKINEACKVAEPLYALTKDHRDLKFLIEALQRDKYAISGNVRFLGLVAPSTSKGDVLHPSSHSALLAGMKQKPDEVLKKLNLQPSDVWGKK